MLEQKPIPLEKALSEDAQQMRARNHYKVSEIFYSLQGEGRKFGTMMVFVRFSDCNLRCTALSAGFDCDTEFVSGAELSALEIVETARKLSPGCTWMLFTGGEPGLQLDEPLIREAHASGFKLAIETNGTVKLPHGIDWITVSPKSAEHTLRQRTAEEVKYVRSAGQALPESTVSADHYLLSPACQPDGSFKPEDLQHCLRLVREHPAWQLSLQLHKLLMVR